MKVVHDTLRQLKSRRLLPVVILLAAALVAVPLLLAKDPEPAEPAALAPVDESAGAATKTIVSVATPEDGKRKVLGSKTNPFRGEPVPEPETATTQSSAPSASTGADAGGSSSAPDVGGSVPSFGSAPSYGTPPSLGTPPSHGTAPASPAPKRYAFQELTVRFGAAEGSPERGSLKRLEPLPSAEKPVLIYLGALEDGKTAVFLVDHGVNAIGDGECDPSPEQCETLRLREGETEFFDVVDDTGKVTAQYDLDLLEIHNGTTASAARASSKAGRRLLKARVSSDGPTGYSWDADFGTLEHKP
jgi:hypothetical protein